MGIQNRIGERQKEILFIIYLYIYAFIITIIIIMYLYFLILKKKKLYIYIFIFTRYTVDIYLHSQVTNEVVYFQFSQINS